MNKNRQGKLNKPPFRETARNIKKSGSDSASENNVRQSFTTPAAPDIEKLLDGKAVYVYLILALLLAFYVFRNFVTFNNLYLFKDIGSDTITYWWPHWVNLSNYIRTLGIPCWSFNEGMGQNIYAFGIGDPFSMFLCMLPKEVIPFAIIFMELFKIIGGGLVVYFYLDLIKCSNAASIAGGLLFAFSGYMILGSGWYFVSTEAFYAALVLYSVERFLRDGVWYLIPIPFCLFAVLQPFFLYLYGLLAALYLIFRSLLGKPDWKAVSVTMLQMGCLAVFGVLLGSFVFLPNAYQLVNNPRVGGGASQFKILSSSPIFQVTPAYINSTLISRLFTNDLTGAGSNFRGWANYLEAPVLYIGLLCLLLAPQTFLFFSRRKRKIMLILVALCIFPLLFTWFRYAFWLFAVPYYRTYTFYISLFILFLAVKALTFIEKTGEVHIKTLAGTLLVLLFFLYHDFIPGYSRIVDTSLRNTVAVFLVLYSGLIFLLHYKKLRFNAMLGILCCMMVELASFSNITVNRRVVMSRDELSERTGYNDYTVDAINHIKATDAGFYRVASDYYPNAAMHMCLNGPQMLNYRGLTSYAEWNQPSYYNFLKELHASNWADTDSQISAKWVQGPAGRYLLYSLVSVKYLLSHQQANNFVSAGYSSGGSFGDVQLMKNNFSLPMGFSYDKYITLNEFRKIKNLTRKDITLLTAFIPSDTANAGLKGMQEIFAKDTGADFTYAQYANLEDSLKHDSLTITAFDDNRIKGNFKNSREKILFFTIPYDNGWKAKVDGKSATTVEATIGFTGIFIGKGNHTVELMYHVPLLTPGVIVSAIALLLYIFALVKYRNKRIIN